MTTCPRCTGKDGAHYMECIVGRLFERILGDGYPWKAPLTPAPTREFVDEALDDWVPERRPEPAPFTALPRNYYDRLLTREAVASISLDGDTHEVVDEPEPTDTTRLNDKDRAALPHLVKQVLDQHGWRQGQLAKALGVSPAQVSLMGSGRGSTTYGYLRKLITLRDQKPAPAPPATDSHASAVARGHRMADLWKERGEEAREWVEMFAADCLILGDPNHNGQPWASRADYVTSAQLAETYNEWAMTNGAPELDQRIVTMGMKSLGYSPRQAIIIAGSKPLTFFGIVIRPRVNWGKPRPSETADAKEDHSHTREIRELMRAAKRRARPSPAPAPVAAAVAVDTVDAEPKTNNGWHTPAPTPAAFSEDDANVTTLEEIEAENRRIMEKTRTLRTAVPAGKRPGREMPKEYRDLVNMLLEIPGWRYEPNNTNGKGKPRIYNPEGQMLPLPNTPSDVKGFLATKTMLKTSLGAPL